MTGHVANACFVNRIPLDYPLRSRQARPISSERASGPRPDPRPHAAWLAARWTAARSQQNLAVDWRPSTESKSQPRKPVAGGREPEHSQAAHVSNRPRRSRPPTTHAQRGGSVLRRSHPSRSVHAPFVLFTLRVRSPRLDLYITYTIPARRQPRHRPCYLRVLAGCHSRAGRPLPLRGRRVRPARMAPPITPQKNAGPGGWVA